MRNPTVDEELYLRPSFAENAVSSSWSGTSPHVYTLAEASLKGTVVVLVAMNSGEPLHQLQSELEMHDTELVIVHNCSEARQLLSTRPEIGVVISGLTLADGAWSDLLTWVVDWRLAAKFVVSSPVVDEQLCSEVFWRGGFDVLIEPYAEDELWRVVENAARGLRSERLSARW